MLVLSMYVDQPATLYTEDGIEIGQIEILETSHGKARVAFKMRDDVAVARSGITKDVAISLLQKKRNHDYGK